MRSMRLLFLLILCVFTSSSSFGQENTPDRLCDSPSILFDEYDPVDDTDMLRCLDSTGEIETLLSLDANAGLYSPSPDGSYIPYTIINSYGPSMYDYDVSLYLYDRKTGISHQLRDQEGHIMARWITPHQLFIQTWDDVIRHGSDSFDVNHRFLYNPQSDEMIELPWPAESKGMVVGYWSTADSFLFAPTAGGLSKITLDGTLIPVALPFHASLYDFDMSSDERLIAYSANCPASKGLHQCLVVYEIGIDNAQLNTNHARMITALPKNYDWPNRIRLSVSGRFIAAAFQLGDQSVIGIYDLEQDQMTCESPVEMKTRGFSWAQDRDILYVAVVKPGEKDEIERDTLKYIYAVDPLTDTMELALPESIRLLSFFGNS